MKQKTIQMKRLVFIIPVLLLVVSCSSHQYHTTRVINQDFTQYKTYGWLPPSDSLSKNYFNNDIARANIMETANIELENRGLVYSKENPDILFRYIAIVNNKSRPIYGGYPNRPWGWGGYYNPWMWHGYWPNRPVGQERYRAGHIIIEALDRATNTVIWQARGTGDVRNPEQAINGLPKVVEGVMAQYPVKSIKK